jgi:hypothetical protein
LRAEDSVGDSWNAAPVVLETSDFVSYTEALDINGKPAVVFGLKNAAATPRCVICAR